MSNKLNKDIKIFEAIKITNTTNILYYDKNIKFNFTYKFINEVGCYLSHLLLIKSLINSKYKYSVIFEDDFYIKNNNFENELNKILNKLSSFDILYLGNSHNNHGSHYIDNIYNINYKQPLWEATSNTKLDISLYFIIIKHNIIFIF
jgi:GR25 family glycosyltransferase involved in LPS biosynthesis